VILGGGNSTRTSSSLPSNAPTAATDIPGGGGGGAPIPGGGGEIHGPDDSYIAGAMKLVSPLIATVAGGIIAGAVLVGL
jgi:hypothetical protein